MKYCVIPCCAYDFYVKVSSLEFSVCVFNSSYWLKEMCEYSVSNCGCYRQVLLYFITWCDKYFSSAREKEVSVFTEVI